MNNIVSLKFCLFFIITITVSHFVFTQSIYTNPITGTNPNDANPYTAGQTHDGKITVSGIGRGTGIVGVNANNRYNADGWNLLFNANNYFEFTLTPNAGYKIDFSSFNFTVQSAAVSGPTSINLRSSVNNFSTNIITSINLLTFGSPVSHSVNLSAAAFQNITTSITFRIYAWGNILGGNFSINDFTFNGLVSCANTSTWSAGSWSNGLPIITTHAIISDNYNTGVGGNQTSFRACSLTINNGLTFSIDNNTYVEVENNIITNGDLIIESSGNLKQNSNTSTISGTGTISVNKQTATKNAWYYYTYWSSPVNGQTIANAFPDTDGDRRFWFNAANYLDANGDNIDDNGDDWVIAAGNSIMTPGRGYVATSGRLGFYPSSDNASFVGQLNNGDIPANIYFNAANISGSWNLIGNPYPSAIDFNAFHATNSSTIAGAAYFWSQSLPPLSSNPGNQNLNFNQNDYAVYNIGSGGVAGASGLIPTQYIPSCQGFFVAGLTTGSVTFTNAMRMADITSNSQFFKNFNSKSSVEENKLWINLTSDNGVFNQVLTAYVDGATNEDDGLSYDAPRLLAKNFTATLYSNMESSNKKFAIQGKAENSLDVNEIINLGFATNINVATIYNLSIAQLQGDFLTNNDIYLKDNLLDKVHNLSDSDYTFTSGVGEFNDRFVVMFSNQSLSTDELLANKNVLKIIDLNNDLVQFTVSNDVMIKNVYIFDLLGRELYKFNGQYNSETYNISNLKNNIYIAKVELSNGAIITKKVIKK